MPGRPVAFGPTRPPPSKRYITPPSPESLVCWRGECVIDPRVRLHRDSTFFFIPDRRALSAAQHATAPSKAHRRRSNAVDRSFRRRTDADRGRPEPPGAENDTDPSDSQIFTERADKERPAAFILIRPFPLPTPPPHRSRAREACVQGQHRPQLQGPHQDDRRAGRPRRLMRRRPSAHLNHRRVERPRVPQTRD
jgi:hypothetical protein